jgi:hypothetical protein
VPGIVLVINAFIQSAYYFKNVNDMKYLSYLVFPLLVLLMSGCSDDDEVPPVETPGYVEYALEPGENSNVFGTISFQKLDDGGVEVTINLENTVPGGEHPAHLHYGMATEETTLMAAMLRPVDGDTGESITVISQLMEGGEFNYDDVLAFDGHVKVHLDAGAGYTTTLAIGNIGLNAVPIEED